MRRLVSGMVAVAVLALVGCGPEMGDGTDDVGQITDEARAAPPTGKNFRPKALAQAKPRGKITYHNGLVMTGPQDVYLIWYGDWANNTTAQTILSDFVSNIGATPYFQINSRYANLNGQGPSGALVFGGAVVDAYSRGTSLSDADLAAIAAAPILANRLPLDPKGIYVILGSADVDATSGFCSAYCGQHSTGSAFGSDFRYVFVGSPDRCPSACSPQAISPNGDAGADGLVNSLINELNTTVSDPALSGWYDREGLESADKCAWNFGPTYTTANGAQANIRLGQRDYLIQRNFWPTSRGGVCTMSASQAAMAIAAGEDVLNEN